MATIDRLLLCTRAGMCGDHIYLCTDYNVHFDRVLDVLVSARRRSGNPCYCSHQYLQFTCLQCVPQA